MAARQFYYAESLSESTTTSTTYTDKVALTFTPDASSDYIFIWSAKETNSSNITSDYKVRLFDDTGSTTLAELNIEGKDVSPTAGDYQSVGGIALMSFGASPSSQTVSIEFAAETGTPTIRISNATITAIKVHADDEYAAADSSSTTSSTTFQDKATLTFTPATQGDYLIITSCEWNDDGGGSGGEYRLLDPTSTAISLLSRFPQDVTTFYPWNTIIQQNLTASSKTYKTQWRALSGTVVMTNRKSRIYALRLDTLNDSSYGEARSRTTTTSTTYQDKVTLTDTPAAQDQLRIAVGMSDGNVTNNSSFINFDQSGSLYEVIYEPSISGGVDGTVSATMTSSVYTGSGASTTWKTQYRSESSALTTGFASSAIAVLQLSVPAEAGAINGPTAVPPAGRKKHAFVGWQKAPLADSGPPELALGRTYEVPYNDRQRALRRHSMQGWQRSPLSDAFVSFSPPLPVYELPQRGRQKNSFVGWQTSPLSDDSLPEIRQQPYYVPERDRKQLWIRHSFQGFQAAPPIPELDLICRWWYDLPQGTWRWLSHSYQGLQAGPLPDEFDVPLPHTTLPVETWRSGLDSFQGTQAGPPPADVVAPPIQPFYDLPVRTWTSERHSYQGVQLAPQPEIMSPPLPQYEVPRGDYNAARYQSFQKGVIPDEFDVPPPQVAVPPGRHLHQYQGSQLAPLAEGTFPPFQSSMSFALPPQSRASSWRMQQAYVGTSAAPLPPSVAPVIPHTWLPLVGVGNGGP